MTFEDAPEEAPRIVASSTLSSTDSSSNEASPPPGPVYSLHPPPAGVGGVGGADSWAAPSTAWQTRHTLSEELLTLLKTWLLSPEHIAHPYPTVEEQADLMARTGLGKKELSQWFTNARRRIWRPYMERHGAPMIPRWSGGGEPGARCGAGGAPPAKRWSPPPPRAPVPPPAPVPAPLPILAAAAAVDGDLGAVVAQAIVTFAPARADRPLAMMQHPQYGWIPVYEAIPPRLAHSPGSSLAPLRGAAARNVAARTIGRNGGPGRACAAEADPDSDSEGHPGNN